MTIGERLDINIEEVKTHYPAWDERANRTKYYYIDRYRLVRDITKKNGFKKIECRVCGSKTKLHAHHVCNDGFSNGDNRLAGYKYLNETKKDLYDRDKQFLVLCEKCHNGYHKYTLPREKMKMIEGLELYIKYKKKVE